MVKLSLPSVQGTAAFCYVWLMLGFLTGTLVLLGPVRWLTDILRSRGYAETTENIAVDCVIVLVYEPTLHRRAVRVTHLGVPVPPAAVWLLPLAHYPLPGRFFAKPSRATVERLIGAIICAEGAIGACTGQNVATVAR